MRAVLEYLDDADYGCRHCPGQKAGCQVPCTYAFLVGVSGAASFLSWKEGWEGDNVGDNVDIHYMAADDAAPEQHIFRAIGYAYEWVGKEPGRDNEAVYRDRIAESLGRGVPVVGYGVIGPPEASIIAGYDEGGDVLLGWSFFQGPPQFSAGVEHEPVGSGEGTGYFRKRDWFKDTDSLLIIGDKVEKPSLRETYREALRWMLEVARTPMVRPEPDAPEWYRQRHNGLAAYDAWADHLLRDDAWPAEDEETLRAHHRVHDHAMGGVGVAEARWYGARFLANGVEHFEAGPGRPGAAAHVLHAAACYVAEHDLMWEVWELAGGIGHPEAHRYMADPAVRRQMASIIRQARDEDARAADHIEHALR
jgi:hypothetical protein